MQRPFSSTEEHDNHIIEKHNEVVSPTDVVVVLGDAVYKGADPEKTLHLIGKMNGVKILIRGNHDIPYSDKQYEPYFMKIIPDGEGLDFDYDSIKCYLTHYPCAGKEDRFNIVGHVHSAWKVQLNCLNVSVDVNHFYPMPVTQIPFHYKAITEFYDTDVWAHRLNVNKKYEDIRGKRGSYLIKK